MNVRPFPKDFVPLGLGKGGEVVGMQMLPNPNAVGVTADWSYPSDAAVWSEGRLRVLPRPAIGYVARAATAINARGEIAGYVHHTDPFPGGDASIGVIWPRRGKPREIPEGQRTVRWIYPSRMTDSGEIAGGATRDGETMGFQWNGKTWTDRGYYASDINERGWVVGESFERTTAVLWRDGKTIEVGSGCARAVNERGQIVGGGGEEGGDAFLWKGGVSQPLTVPGATSVEAIGINEKGWIIGAADRRPVLWRGKTVCYLDDALKKATCWKSMRLTAINDRGEILAAEGAPGSYEGRGALLRLE